MARFLYGASAAGGATLKEADLTAQVNSSNTTYTMPENYQFGTLRVYWNGIRQRTGDTITETSQSTFTTSFTALSGDVIIVDYVAA
mgnify:FL=1|tara:strand:- start:1751 stop:2008 length:258 start_codon:yes stop_codon:yes gene_type:complete